MLINTAQFISQSDSDAVVEAYSTLFLEPYLPQSEECLRNEEEHVAEILEELKEAAEGIKADNGLLLFAVMIPSGQGINTIPDIFSMRFEHVKYIPHYMRSHPRLEAGEEVPYTDEEPGTPLLLTDLDAVLHSEVYIPDDVAGYDLATMAALVYGATTFGEDLKTSEQRKARIASQLQQAAVSAGKENEDLDRLVFSLRPRSYILKESSGPLLAMETMRYNAMLEVYERLYTDIAPTLRTRSEDDKS